ncbi:MAG: DNA primase [Clostridia bacterium]|nr:DNA primase [Clostridia bacterium]
MFFNEKFIEELKQKNNIVDVVGRYCVLKKRGNNHWACCPLPNHSERTPSFTVNESGQFYKCFGCGRGGDVITFVETMENLDYVGAVTLLAEQAGMRLPDEDGDEEKVRKTRSDRDRLLLMMKTAARFYVDNLRSPAALAHREYLVSRGIDEATANAFGIGASTDFGSLPERLKKSGFTEEEMIKCGVCMKNEHGIYDSLHGRLIIPIINNLGGVIAFGGRLLEKKPNFAKYKNTQETELFIKNRTLYNINNLKKERAKNGINSIIMVEGYMDAISVYQAGFRNVVASMGTSLTVEQARTLKRYSDTVYISYDGDGAGQKATIRGLEILKNEGITVKVVKLPEGADPDDVIKQRGAEGYRELLDESVPLVDFKLDLLKKRYDLGDASDKRKYVAEAIKVINEEVSDAVREDLLRKLGRQTNTTFESLQRDSERSSDGRKEETPEVRNTERRTADGVVSAERFVLCAMINGKSYAKGADLGQADFTDAVRKKLIEMIISRREEGKEIIPSALSAYLEESDLAEYNAVLESGYAVFDSADERKYYDDCLSKISQIRIENDIKALTAAFAAETDLDARRFIASKISELTAKNKK